MQAYIPRNFLQLVNFVHVQRPVHLIVQPDIGHWGCIRYRNLFGIMDQGCMSTHYQTIETFHTSGKESFIKRVWEKEKMLLPALLSGKCLEFS